MGHLLDANASVVLPLGKGWTRASLEVVEAVPPKDKGPHTAEGDVEPCREARVVRHHCEDCKVDDEEDELAGESGGKAPGGNPAADSVDGLNQLLLLGRDFRHLRDVRVGAGEEGEVCIVENDGKSVADVRNDHHDAVPDEGLVGVSEHDADTAERANGVGSDEELLPEVSVVCQTSGPNKDQELENDRNRCAQERNRGVPGLYPKKADKD
mmetsp:Transcript_15828/g.32537  ORF Transcript_15828/g.32537 Transcript_15828/m.32537 type:complete len:211 (+) Transcript_15828:749-1381(+)